MFRFADLDGYARTLISSYKKGFRYSAEFVPPAGFEFVVIITISMSFFTYPLSL
jgi:hypothetical protein